MPTVDELATQIGNLRQQEMNLYDREVLGLADITIAIAKSATIRAQARLIAAQLRTLGAADLANKAERGWAYVDMNDEDDFARWCEEQREKEACRYLGYECGLCPDCRRNGFDALA